MEAAVDDPSVRQSSQDDTSIQPKPAATAHAHARPREDSTPAPPFWNRHGRTDSTVSYTSIRHLRPTPIQLEDHSEEDHEQSRACWAKHVTIGDYVVVSGPTGIGAYVVWNCTVETLKGGPFTIRKRYAIGCVRHWEEIRSVA